MKRYMARKYIREQLPSESTDGEWIFHSLNIDNTTTFHEYIELEWTGRIAIVHPDLRP